MTIKHIAASLLAALLLAMPASAAQRSVALTFDDLPDLSAGDDDRAAQSDLTEKLVSALARDRVPAIGFVNEDKLVDDDDRPDPRRIALLGRWLDSGLQLGNHTRTHVDLDETPVPAYEDDIEKGEVITRPLCTQRGVPFVWFRHPYLDTGKTVAIRDEVDAFLAAHGYRVAPVTIDDSEWIYALAYRNASAWRRPLIRRSYLRYMAARFAWSEAKSRRLFGREIAQVLLLHASSLNADAMPALIAMITRRGYRLVSIDEAVRDPAYSTPERWTGGGVSWLERWAAARGVPDREFEHDPLVPPWIQKLAGEKDE